MTQSQKVKVEEGTIYTSVSASLMYEEKWFMA